MSQFGLAGLFVIYSGTSLYGLPCNTKRVGYFTMCWLLHEDVDHFLCVGIIAASMTRPNVPMARLRSQLEH